MRTSATVNPVFSRYFSSNLQVLVESHTHRITSLVDQSERTQRSINLHKLGLPIKLNCSYLHVYNIVFHSFQYSALHYYSDFFSVLFIWTRSLFMKNNAKYGIYYYNEVLSNLCSLSLKDRRIGVHLIRQLIRISTE